MVLLCFFLTVPCIAVKPFSPTLYRVICTHLLNMVIPAFLCVPVSWCGLQVQTNDMDTLMDSQADNCVVLSNHGGRTDWVIGLYMGFARGPSNRARVGFVAEALVQFLPVVGWFRYAVEDIYLWRSFKQDAPTIKRNIAAFHSSGVKRTIFLAPEGAIVDKSKKDMQYVKDCQAFCVAQGYEPFQYVLTPRYKGSACLTAHSKTVISVTMAYVQDGVLLNELLSSNERVVPDLYTILRGEVKVYVDVQTMGGQLTDAKTELMNDYARKDKIMAHFHAKGAFPDERKGWEHFPVEHFVMNITLFMWFATLFTLAYSFGTMSTVVRTLIGFFLFIASSHGLGEFFGDGLSREALPFETTLKALLMLKAKPTKKRPSEQDVAQKRQT